MLDRPSIAGIVRRFALPALATSLATGALLWPSRAWVYKTLALLGSGLLVLLTELPPPALRPTVVRGSGALVALASTVLSVIALTVVGLLAGGPPDRLLPAAIVVVAIAVVGHIGDSGFLVRRGSTEAALALVAVLVAVGVEQAHRLPSHTQRAQSREIAAAPDPPVPVTDAGAAAPYSPPDPNLPPVFGGPAPGAPLGSCPEELSEENTALIWMRLWERRDEGRSLRDEDEARPSAVVPRRLHCACAPHRDRSNLQLAYCGRTRELCQAEAGTRAEAGSCSVVAVSVTRRLDCELKVRGISVQADDASLTVSLRSVSAASKLVPQWATLDARELGRGRIRPTHVQRLRWARGSTAPADWRATNFPGAKRAATALGRALSRTGLRCQGAECEGGDSPVVVNWCEGTNSVVPAAERANSERPGEERVAPAGRRRPVNPPQ